VVALDVGKEADGLQMYLSKWGKLEVPFYGTEELCSEDSRPTRRCMLVHVQLLLSETG
jgi:hypothetical protein